MKIETRAFKASELRVATDPTGQRTLTGYAAVFGSPSEDMGGWVERCDPHCFDRTLAAGADVRGLVEHDPARILGRTKAGTLQVSTDASGLRFTCALPDTSVARDLVTSIERGDLDSCSFGFVAQRTEWSDNPDGTSVRTLMDVDLYDVSVVTYPAYTSTSVDVRSIMASMPAEYRAKFERRKLTDQCTCTCPQCMAGNCGICSSAPQCDGAERDNTDNTDNIDTDSLRASASWHEDAMLRLRIAEVE